MVELVDTRDLKSRGPCARAGSTPALGTTNQARITMKTGDPGFFYILFLLIYLHISSPPQAKDAFLYHLFMTQGVNRIKTRRFSGRKKAKNDTNSGGKEK